MAENLLHLRIDLNDERKCDGIQRDEKEKRMLRVCSECNVKDSSTRTGLPLIRNVCLPSTSGHYSIEKLGRSPYLNSMNDLREELLKTKRIYAMAIRENSLIRTKLKISEKERKRREEEINELLTKKIEENSKCAERLQVFSMRKKLLQYEKVLRDKNDEISKLLTNRSTIKATETKKLLVKMENECNQLKVHLAHSISESEYLREKHQYTQIVDKLTEENMQLRKLIGDYEKRRKKFEMSETAKVLEHIYGDKDLINGFRKCGIATKKQADYYKTALLSLVQSKKISRIQKRSYSESGSITKRRFKYSNTSTPLPNSVSTGNLNRNSSVLSDPILTQSKKRQQKKEKCLVKNQYHSPSFQVVALDSNYAKNDVDLITDLNGYDGAVKLPGLRQEISALSRMYYNASSEDDNEEKDEENSPSTLIDDEATEMTVYESSTEFFNEKEQRIILVAGSESSPEFHCKQSSITSKTEKHKSAYTPEHCCGKNKQRQSLGNLTISSEHSSLYSDTNLSKNYIENLRALKLEYAKSVGADEEKNELSFEAIIRTIQSHILRVKMCRVREQNLIKPKFST